MVPVKLHRAKSDLTPLPRLGACDLGGLDHISWVVTAYLLAVTSVTPLYGKLGDLYGRKKLFMFTIFMMAARWAVATTLPTDS